MKVESARGPVSKNTRTAVQKPLENESGTRDILQRRLALEAAINPDTPLVSGNRAVLLQDGPATYAATFSAIRKARDHSKLETHIFEDGEIGSRFAARLLEKQAEGVQVNPIYDSVGSLPTPPGFFERPRAGGIHLVEFNPVNPAKVNKNREWLLNNQRPSKIAGHRRQNRLSERHQHRQLLLERLLLQPGTSPPSRDSRVAKPACN